MKTGLLIYKCVFKFSRNDVVADPGAYLCYDPFAPSVAT